MTIENNDIRIILSKLTTQFFEIDDIDKKMNLFDEICLLSNPIFQKDIFIGEFEKNILNKIFHNKNYHYFINIILDKPLNFPNHIVSITCIRKILHFENSSNFPQGALMEFNKLISHSTFRYMLNC